LAKPQKRNQSSKIGSSRRPLCSSSTPNPPTKQMLVKARKERQVQYPGMPYITWIVDLRYFPTG